jgi:hypothetical protein
VYPSGGGGYRPLPHGEINEKKGRKRGKGEKYVARGKSNEKYHMKKVCLGKKKFSTTKLATFER